MRYKNCFLLIALLLFSSQSQAQFRKLIKKAQDKALEHVLDKEVSDTNNAQEKPDDASSPYPEDRSQEANNEQTGEIENDETQMKAPPTIDFPKTGETVHAIQAVFGPVYDADVAKIVSTPAGKYAFQLARKKGLTGTDTEIFQQMMAAKNRQLMDEIEEAVEEKFPNQKAQDDNPRTGDNPAWGGVSIPSAYFEYMVGSFNIWITPRYLKLVLRHDHVTMGDMFGLNAAGITDFEKRIRYSIGSVLGVNYTMIHHLDSSRDRNIYATYGLIKQIYLGIPGVKIEPGKARKYGKYNTVSEKIVIPVRPFIDPETGKKSDGLLQLHDILSGREDSRRPFPHYDPRYTISYEYFFTHDLDPALSALVEHAESTGITGREGVCIGAKIVDENGNSVNYRLTQIQKDVSIDKGEFQVPPDYPVMTQEQLNEAVKKKFGLKSLFKHALKNAGSDNGNK